MVQILREVAGSGLIMQPSENDLASPELRPYLDRYLRGKGVDVEYKSRLYTSWRTTWRSLPQACAKKCTNTGTAATPTGTASTCSEASTKTRPEAASRTWSPGPCPTASD